MDRPLRLLIHAGNFAPEPTGIGKYTGELAAWLAGRGHRVEVITGFPYYPEWKLSGGYARTGFRKEHWQGVRLHRVPHYIPPDGKATSRRRMLIDLTMFLASSLPWLRLLLSRRQPDFIIAVCPPLLSGLWPCIIRALRGTPWIYHIQDFQLDAAQKLGMLKGALLGSLLCRLEKRLLRSASAVSSITGAMCRLAVSKGARPSRVLELPNWSDIHAVHPSPRDNAFRASFNLGPDQLLVMYAGAMGRKQGLDLVLDSAARLRDDGRFHFAMIGNGYEAELLRQRSEERGLTNMSFLPLQPVERLNEMLAAGDIHLVVQRAHAADLVMPSKLTNILAAGRPVAATADPGTALWDAVHEAGTGRAIRPECVESLTAALIELAESPELRSGMGRSARAYAEKKLDRDAILMRFEYQLAMLRKYPDRPVLHSPVVTTGEEGEPA